MATVKLEDVKSIIRSLLISTQKNMKVLDLCRDYRESEGKAIPYHELGFKSTVDFLKSLSDTVVVSEGPSVGGQVMYYIRPLVSQSTKHMEDFVLEQENKGKKRMPRRPRGISSHERSRGRSSPPLRMTFNQQRSSSTWNSRGSHHQRRTQSVQDNFRGTYHEPDIVKDSFQGSHHQGQTHRAQDNFRGMYHEPDNVQKSSQGVQENVRSVQDSVKGSKNQELTHHAQNNFRGMYHEPDNVQESSQGVQENVRSVQDSVKGSKHQELTHRAQNNFRGMYHEPDNVQDSSQGVQENVRSVQDSVKGSKHQELAHRAQNNFRGMYHEPDNVQDELNTEQSHMQKLLHNLTDSAQQTQEGQRVSAFIPTTVFHASNAAKLQADSPEFVPRKSVGTSANQRIPQTPPFAMLKNGSLQREAKPTMTSQQVQSNSISPSNQALPLVLPTFPLQAGIMSTIPSPKNISYTSYLQSSMSNLVSQQHCQAPRVTKEEPNPDSPPVIFQDSAGFKPIIVEKPPGFRNQESIAEPPDSPVPDYNPACGVHEKVVKKLVDLLQLHPQGIQAIELLSTYKRHYKAVLDYSGYGFNCVMDMVSALNNHITAKRESDCSDFILLSKTSPVALNYQKEQKIQEETRMNQIPLKVQDRTKRILEDFRRGLRAKDFAAHYRSYFNEVLNPSNFGHSCVDTFLMAMDKHCLLVSFEQGEIAVYPIPLAKQEEPSPNVEVTRQRRQFAPSQPTDTVQCGESLPPFQWPQQACINSEVAIKIEFIQSPLRFFYTFDGQSRLDVIQMMLEMTEKYTPPTVDLRVRKMKKDLLVVVSHENILHRARILQVLDEFTCIVFCVDFGNMFTVRKEHLYYLRCKYATIPAQAQMGALFNVIPINGRTDWADTDTAALFHMVNHAEPLSAHLKQLDQGKGCASFTIYTKINGRLFCVNNEMVRLGVADFYDEKYIYQVPGDPVTTSLASSESRHAQLNPTAPVSAFAQHPYSQFSRVPGPVKPLTKSAPMFGRIVSSTPQPSLISQHLNHNSQTGWYSTDAPGPYTSLPPVSNAYSHIIPSSKSLGRSTGSYAMDNEVAALTSKLQQLPTYPAHTEENDWYHTETGYTRIPQHNDVSPRMPEPKEADETLGSGSSHLSHYYELEDSEDDAEMQQQAQDDGRIFIIADKWGRDTLHIVNYQDLPHLLLEEVASLLKCGSGAAILRLTKGHVTLHDIKLHRNELPALFQQINDLQLGKYVIDQQVQLLPLRTLGVVLSLIRNQHVDKLRSDLMRHLMHTINSFNHNDPCWFRQP